MKIFFGNKEGFCIFHISKKKNYIAHTIGFLVDEIVNQSTYSVINEEFFLKRNIFGYVEYHQITTRKNAKNMSLFRVSGFITSYSEKDLRMLVSYLNRLKKIWKLKIKLKNIKQKKRAYLATL